MGQPSKPDYFVFIMKKKLPRFVTIYLKIYLSILTIAIPVWLLAQPAVPIASISLIVLMIYLSLLQLRKKNEYTSI